MKNLPRDLESTRITNSSSDESIKVQASDQSSGKKNKPLTPWTTAEKKKPTTVEKTKTPVPGRRGGPRAAAVKTPRYLDICDSDTSTESSSDSDFEEDKPDETWNASSDEEEVSEADRIKKLSIARKSRRYEEFIFIPDDSDKPKKVDDLDRFEFKKPPGMPGAEMPKKVSKRKLFTHTHYDDDFVDVSPVESSTTSETDKNDSDDEVNVQVVPKLTLKELQEKRDSAKKLDPFVKPSPVTRKPTKTKIATPKGTTIGAFSFLKSLDENVNLILCHPDALTYRNNYKSKKSELADKLFALYNEKVFGEQLKSVPITWNKKLLNTAGRCNNSRRNGSRHSQLELSDKVLTSADRLRCTLIHEMCHAATWILNGENGHGATWKRWAAKANATFPELPKINVCHDYVIEYRYTYQCVSCKAKSQAHSKSRKVENIRCSICKGAIEVFLNKKTKEGVVMTPVREATGFPKFVKLKYQEVKKPNMTHKEVMQVLSSQFASLSVEEKQNL